MNGKQLTDLVGTAGATVGLIIGTSIFLQMLSNKYTAIFDLYRRLTGEFRQMKAPSGQGERQAGLTEQIKIYYDRLIYIRRACIVLTLSELIFLLTILLACGATLWPDQSMLTILGAITVVCGLCGIAAGAIYELLDNKLSEHAIRSEIKDLDELGLTK